MTPPFLRRDRKFEALSHNRLQEIPFMKSINIAAASAALAAALAIPTASRADVPVLDRVGNGAVIKCGFSSTGATVFASHADKIIFTLTGGLQAADPVDQPALNQIPRNTELDIKVLDNPRHIADLKGKVLTFIGAVDNAAARLQVTIVDVEYAMVCPSTTSGL